MELRLLQDNSQLGASVATSPRVFSRDYNEALVYQVVVAYQTNARSGNRKQKDREEVKHTTKRPRRQKGTGHTRANMSSSLLWHGGGRTFPNSPEENFSQKVDKKMYRTGMRSIYSQPAREGRVNAVDGPSVNAPKTKLLADEFRAMGLDSVLVVTDNLDGNFFLVSRNLAHVLVVEPHHADPLSLVHYKKVLVTRTAVTQIKELLK